MAWSDYSHSDCIAVLNAFKVKNYVSYPALGFNGNDRFRYRVTTVLEK